MASAAPPIGHLRGERVVVIGLALLLLAGVTRAASLAWVCDDAFITFRYADHLVKGIGLVYNEGEYVEGYTNLLWTLGVAAGMALGASAERTSMLLGIACYVGLAGTLAFASWRRREQGLPFLPIAAAVVLVSDDFHEWATGGLETMLFAWLATLGCLLAVRGRALPAGFAFALLTLTRPDGLLFAGAGAAACWLQPGGTPRRAGVLLAPVAATLALLLPFKLYYYGELLPTAFYSKSVLEPYWSQGVRYVGLYLSKNWFLPVALFCACALRWRRWRAGDADLGGVVLAGTGLAFIAYLAHVGGDFMFARRILPAVPLLLLALEDEFVRTAGRWRPVLAGLCVVAAALPYPVYADVTPPVVAGVGDERSYYPEAALSWRRQQAEALASVLDGLDVRVMYSGGMCNFAYYSGLPYLAEMTGLTQYSIARQPLDRRGRPGHEKRADRRWLVENGIHLMVHHTYPPLGGPVPESRLRVGNLVEATIVLYDDELMARLADVPGVHFQPIEQVLERDRRRLLRASREQAEAIYTALDAYYFRSGSPAATRAAREFRALVEARP